MDGWMDEWMNEWMNWLMNESGKNSYAVTLLLLCVGVGPHPFFRTYYIKERDL